MELKSFVSGMEVKSFFLALFFNFVCHYFGCNSAGPAVPMPEAELASLLENKEGLVVSDFPDFGALLLGESKELVVWIE